MWTGRRFRIRRNLAALERAGDHETRVSIPTGAMVQVVRGPYARPTRRVKIQWTDRELEVLAVDLEACGEETRDGGSSGG